MEKVNLIALRANVDFLEHASYQQGAIFNRIIQSNNNLYFFDLIVNTQFVSVLLLFLSLNKLKTKCNEGDRENKKSVDRKRVRPKQLDLFKLICCFFLL